MKKALVLVSLMGLCVAGASANTLQLFFSETPWSAGMTAPAITNPVVDASAGPVTMYLWAQTNKVGTPWDIWQGMNLNLVGPVGEAGFAYNPENPDVEFVRWEASSTLTWTDTAGMYAAGVSTGGLGSANDPTKVSGTTTTRFFPVAEITFQPGTYDVFLAIGSGGVARRGGDSAVDGVYFGIGDQAVSVRNFGGTSTVADLTITPEPASLILLSLAGLFLRRR